MRPSYPRTQHLRAVGGQVEHYLYWWANHLHSRMDLQSSESCSALWKSVLLSLWKSLEVATVYIAKYPFLKSVPLSEDLWIPQLADGEISQGKVVQIGDYPRDWSQDNPLAGTAQIRLQLLTKDGHQSALERVSPGKTNLKDCFCVLSYRFILKEKKHGKKAYIFAYLWYFYSK